MGNMRNGIRALLLGHLALVLVIAAVVWWLAYRPIECDADGLISAEYLKGIGSDERLARNFELLERRANVLSNNPQARWYTAESLAKAEGCP